LIDISPSILAANWARLGEAVELVEKAGASSIHVDVMDGHYVPNLGFGPYAVSALKEHSLLPFHVHLEIMRPERVASLFIDAGADLIIFHPETCEDSDKMLDQIQSRGCKAGIALHPAIPGDSIETYLHRLDLLLLMSIEPGFGGQSFKKESLQRIRRVSRFALAQNQKISIGIDGGITFETAQLAVEAGATLLVAGTAIYGAKEPADAIRELQRVAGKAYNQSL
jgi:ribulose-phosphate 3-epimerase